MPVVPRSPWRRAMHRWRALLIGIAIVSAVLLVSNSWLSATVGPEASERVAQPLTVATRWDAADLAAGTVAIPVAVADPASRALAQHDGPVTLLITSADGAVHEVTDVTVIQIFAAPDSVGTGNLLSGDTTDTYMVVAIPRSATTLVTESQLPVRVAVPASRN